jgi:uncharacterized protein (UPF0261 family)
VPEVGYLNPTFFIDSDQASIEAKSRELTAHNAEAREKAIRLFYFVRDQIRYNAFSPRSDDLYIENLWGEVAEAAGSSLKAVAGSGDMAANMETMVNGAVFIARNMVKEGKVHGVIGMGGCTGTLMMTTVLQGLPFGFPKVMISSVAAQPGLSNQFLKTSDTMVFHTVIEISGLSDPVQNLFDREARAVFAMAYGPAVDPHFNRERGIAVTMMSPCERTSRSIRLALEKEGYQVIGFQANGISTSSGRGFV